MFTSCIFQVEVEYILEASQWTERAKWLKNLEFKKQIIFV